MATTVRQVAANRFASEREAPHEEWLARCLGLGSCRNYMPSASLTRLVNLLCPLAGGAVRTRSVRKLFDGFALLQRRSPAALHWVHPLPSIEGTYITTRFQHPVLHRYSGHEIVIFTRERGSYYWMPGARRDATGHVPLGSYLVDAELAEGGGSIRLRLEKRHPAAFVLVPPSATNGDLHEPTHRIVPRPLPPGVLPEELHALVEIGLIFQLQALHAGVLHPQVIALMADGAVATACRSISPRLDTLLGLIEDALSSEGNIFQITTQ